ncbi:MAG: S41 family peptidase [Dehalococcoidia bacterium]
MSADSDRLERLAGLARVWGHLYFYHPALSVPDPLWEDLLPAAIPRVEAAATPEAYAAALNDALLRHLDDPWTYAAIARDQDETASPEPDIEQPRTEALPNGVAYLDARDTVCYDQPDYLTRLGTSVERCRESAGLILDLRWGRPPRTPLWPDAFGFFLSAPLRSASVGQRVHAGWGELPYSVYDESWQMRPGAILWPVQSPGPMLHWHYRGTAFPQLPRYDGPLALIVDDVSIARLDDPLTALQTAGRAFVVHETADRVHAQDEPARIWGEVEVPMRLYRLAGPSGWLEVRPDRVLTKGEGDVVQTAKQLLLHGGPARLEGRPLPAIEPPIPEPPPPSPEPLSREVRLLGLFKIWTVLGDFFPHLDLADLDLPNLITEWVPRVEAAGAPGAYERVLVELAARLNDSHVSVNYPAVRQILGTHIPPVELRAVEGQAAVWTLHPGAAEAGFRRGMVVTHVDGTPIAEAMAERAALLSASTAQARERATVGLALAGAEDSEVTLTVEDGNGLREISASRAMPLWSAMSVEERGEPVRVEHGFGYVDLARVATSADFDAALSSFRDSPGLILDMRGYPRFFVQRDVVSRLVDRPVSSTQFHVPVRSGSHSRSWHVSTIEVQPHAELRYDGPVAVLIDVRAESAAEDFCIYLRNAGRVTFVGTATAGTNGNVTIVRLPGGGSLSFTGMRVTYGDGSRFQNIGIVPDVPAEPTLAGLRAGRDEVLEAGVETLRRLTGPRRRGV